jgi:hypothetical protein
MSKLVTRIKVRAPIISYMGLPCSDVASLYLPSSAYCRLRFRLRRKNANRSTHRSAAGARRHRPGGNPCVTRLQRHPSRWGPERPGHSRLQQGAFLRKRGGPFALNIFRLVRHRDRRGCRLTRESVRRRLLQPSDSDVIRGRQLSHQFRQPWRWPGPIRICHRRGRRRRAVSGRYRQWPHPQVAAGRALSGSRRL